MTLNLVVSIRIAVASALIALAAPVAAQETESVAAFKDWSVFNPASPRECYIVSPPVSSNATRDGSPAQVRRGDIRLFVTLRPEQGVIKEVSFTGGYPFAPDSTVEVAISGKEYIMNVGSGESGEWAWPPAPEKDTELVSAMRAGSGATVTARSARGTVTKDEFSLLGFTAALEKAEELCK